MNRFYRGTEKWRKKISLIDERKKKRKGFDSKLEKNGTYISEFLNEEKRFGLKLKKKKMMGIMLGNFRKRKRKRRKFLKMKRSYFEGRKIDFTFEFYFWMFLKEINGI